MFSFSSEIFIIGVNPYVAVPDTVLQELFTSSKKRSGPIPVVGTLNNKEFKQTVVKYSGVWRLYLNGIMRKAAGIDVGDIAHVQIMFDPKPRTEKMPPSFKAALSQNITAQKKYENLAPYRKKEILRYLNSMKTEESLHKNIKKVILHLLGKKTDTLHALMRTKK